MTPEPEFEERYWTERSAYRKFEDYRAGLEATKRWYRGFLRLVEPYLPVSGARVLDAGCGHGALVHLLSERGCKVTGLDRSRWMIDQAARHSPHIDFVEGDLTALSVSETYDTIFCLEVLEHIAEPGAALSEMGRLLKPGGRLVATTPNLRPLMPWWDPLTSDPTHVSVHEPSWWREAAREAGLTVERVSTFVTIPVIWRFSERLSIWIPLGRHTGPGTLIVAGTPPG